MKMIVRLLSSIFCGRRFLQRFLCGSSVSSNCFRLGHIAIAVPSLREAIESWSSVLRLSPSRMRSLRAHGVRVVFFDLENTRVELLEPLGLDSPLSSYLAKHPRGGVHHICLETQGVESLHSRLRSEGVNFANEGRIMRGAHGNPVFFVHPQVLSGMLVEFEGVVAGTRKNKRVADV